MEETLIEIVGTALRLIPSAAEASISTVQARRTVDSRAASGELPRVVDALQTQTRQGPCLDAAFGDRIVRVPDMSAETRWPRFARRAWEAGARSMLSVQIYVAGDDLGALNLYGSEVGDFGQECEEVGALIATHAAIALADAKEIRDLNDALTNRDVIGQAKGILMERYKLTSHQAFVLLTSASSTTHQKLSAVAAQLTHTGALTTPGGDRSPVTPRAGAGSDVEG